MLEDSTDDEVKEIESLLDEVETKYLTNRKPYNPDKIVVSNAEARECECTKKTETNWAEVDELLKDFKFEDPNPFLKSKNKPWNRQPVTKLKDELSGSNGDVENNLELKCHPVYLAGSYEMMGFSQAGFEKPCDRLKCVKCDFGVSFFDNFSWDPSIDYLFLRNNMPDFDKMAPKLVKNRGTRAYACQCQFASIGKFTNVKALPQLKWVCGKHPGNNDNSGGGSSSSWNQ